MYPGRSEDIKKDLAEKAQKFFSETMDLDPKYFSVSVEEIEKDKWAEEVVQKIDANELYIDSDF